MKVIGLTGKAGSGKDFVAQLMLEAYSDDGIDLAKFAFAQPLKEAVMVLFGLSHNQVMTRDGKNKKTEWKWDDLNPDIRRDKTGYMTSRDILQIFGTEVIRNNLNKNHWIMLAEQQMLDRNADISVFTDTRFENEIALIKKHGGIIINVHGRSDVATPSHSSELDIPYDFRLENDERTTPNQIWDQIKEIFDLKWK